MSAISLPSALHKVPFIYCVLGSDGSVLSNRALCVYFVPQLATPLFLHTFSSQYHALAHVMTDLLHEKS